MLSRMQSKRTSETCSQNSAEALEDDMDRAALLRAQEWVVRARSRGLVGTVELANAEAHLARLQ